MTTFTRIARIHLANIRTDYADYLAERKAAQRIGYRAAHCEHGTSQWTDYDAICGGCEEGWTMSNPLHAMREAISRARRTSDRIEDLLAGVAALSRAGVVDHLDQDSAIADIMPVPLARPVPHGVRVLDTLHGLDCDGCRKAAGRAASRIAADHLVAGHKVWSHGGRDRSPYARDYDPAVVLHSARVGSIDALQCESCGHELRTLAEPCGYCSDHL